MGRAVLRVVEASKVPLPIVSAVPASPKLLSFEMLKVPPLTLICPLYPELFAERMTVPEPSKAVVTVPVIAPLRVKARVAF